MKKYTQLEFPFVEDVDAGYKKLALKEIFEDEKFPLDI